MLQLLEKEKQQLEDEKAVVVEDLESLKRDQEDLLVLLEDQESKIKTYKQRLKALGEQVLYLLVRSRCHLQGQL